MMMADNWNSRRACWEIFAFFSCWKQELNGKDKNEKTKKTV
jgi:hypothetical protein